MPICLRPTAPIAPDAILVGDPGRALLLAQTLLEQPKMSNHARGLWGYHGANAEGRKLTVQSTGIGGPSAALVLSDLAELGVRRAVRVGTCMAVDASLAPGELLLVEAALATGGSAAAFGVSPGQAVQPAAELTAQLEAEMREKGKRGIVASVDAYPGDVSPPAGAHGLDMQTAPLLARAKSLGLAAAALLIASERAGLSDMLEKDALEDRERLTGRIAARVLSA